MGRNESIPAPAVRRLSLYLRQLEAFRDSNLHTVSSKQLGQALNITDAQVRKDLAYFGQFGQPGIGYGVDELIAKLRHILGTDQTWRVLLAGAGNLGRALLSYRGFQSKGFEVVAVFDNDPSLQGQPIGEDGPVVQSIEQLVSVVQKENIRLALLAVPAAVAQSVTDGMIGAGIKGILNFAPVSLLVPGDVTVANVDLAVHLEQLSFSIGSSGL
ncbi:MAG: redox-sensing transcriptional repressor Rex [Planctomycetes bacterium]|nr:redox-sensing transcriptional repressor Rex [Planctomycetota bacterium]